MWVVHKNTHNILKTSQLLQIFTHSNECTCKLILLGEPFCHSYSAFSTNVFQDLSLFCVYDMNTYDTFPISSRISWSQFKTYFVFKLEKVMDDFHASTPEHRAPHNPNVDYVPFEEMKTRILKIVDGYNGWVNLKIFHFINCKQPHIQNKIMQHVVTCTHQWLLTIVLVFFFFQVISWKHYHK